MVECLQRNPSQAALAQSNAAGMEQGEGAYEEVLLSCGREGDAERAEALLQRLPQLNVNARDRRTGNTALMWAASRGHTKVLQTLLQHGADQTLVNSEQQTAFELATPTLQRVLAARAPESSLQQAAWLCNVDGVRRALALPDAAGEVNATNSEGLSPLLLLSRGVALTERLSELGGATVRPVEAAKVLLKHGATPGSTEAGSGRTALHLASASCSRHGPALVEALLRHGADALARDRCAFTPLHCAAKVGDVGAIRVLVQHLGAEAKLDLRGRAGSTPLHLCAMGGHEEAIRFLLKAGANPQTVDEGGQTPIEVAKNRRIKAILQGKTPPPDSASSQKKGMLGPVRAPCRLSRTRSFGAAKEMPPVLPSMGVGPETDMTRSPTDLNMEGTQVTGNAAGVTPRLGAISRSSVIGLSATTPLPPSRPDSGSVFSGARNNLFRRSTPSRTSRPMAAFHLPPMLTTAKSPAPFFVHRRESSGGELESTEGLRGRASTRTYLEDLEDSLPSVMIPGTSTEELGIPDTIKEAEIESARSSRVSGQDILPSPVIHVPRMPSRRRNVTFSEEDADPRATPDVRRSLELASPRLASGRRHARTGSCPEVDVISAVAAKPDPTSTSPRSGPEVTLTTTPTPPPVPAPTGLKAVRVSREATTVRAPGPPTGVKKGAVTKLKAPLVSNHVQARGGVKMSPLKGRSMVLSDKQKSDRLKKVAARPSPEVAKTAVEPGAAGVILKPSGTGAKKDIELGAAARDGEKEAEKSPEPNSAKEELVRDVKASEKPKSSAISKEKFDSSAGGTKKVEPMSEAPKEGKVTPDAAVEVDKPFSEKETLPAKASVDAKAVEEVKSARKLQEDTKTSAKASEPSVKTTKKPSSAKGSKQATGVKALPSKESSGAARSTVKALTKRKVSANQSGRRRLKKKSATAVSSTERSTSPTIPIPADGTALISGIGWHVHTTADATDLSTTPPTMSTSPRSAVFASKYPVIAAIGTSFDAEEEEIESEDSEYRAPHPRSQLDMATPSLPLREPFSVGMRQEEEEEDPTPRNRRIDDRDLFEGAMAFPPRHESQLAPVPEPRDVQEIEGPLFDDEDEVLPFIPDSEDEEEEDPETIAEELQEAIEEEDTMIDLDDDDDDEVASNAEWHKRVHASDHLDLLRQGSRADHGRAELQAPTPASASGPQLPTKPAGQGHFEQSWRHDTLRSNCSSMGPGDTLKSNCSDLSSVDMEAGDLRFEELSWKRGNLLGKGSFGRVFCGMTAWGQLMAVKQIEISSEDRSLAELRKIEEEIHLLKTLKHRHIVQFYGTSRTTDTVNIFMEYLPGGSIASLLNRFGVFEERVFCRYARQVLEGVCFLHANNIIHRDIKGANIMLMPNGRIKLIDFGCAKRLAQHTSQQQLQNTMQGSPYWMAPEVILETGHGPKSDCWSIGCTVFEMATTKPPWANLPPYPALFAIGSGEGAVPALDPSRFSAAACAFVTRCLTRNPDLRPSSAELLQDPFVLRTRRSSMPVS